MTETGAAKLRQLDALRVERKTLIAVASRVSDQARTMENVEDEATLRALRQARWQVCETLSGLTRDQRSAERHDADTRDGTELLEAWLTTLKAERAAAQQAAEPLREGSRERGNHIRKANAYNWAVGALRTAAEAGLAQVRAELAAEIEELA